MNRRAFLAAAASAAVVAPASRAFARFRGGAFLHRAVPGVGLTVSGPVREIRLYFNREVITVFSSIKIINSAGAMVPAIGPINDPSGQEIVIFRLRHALLPGTYNVSWQVVSIHRRPTSGTFHFTIA